MNMNMNTIIQHYKFLLTTLASLLFITSSTAGGLFGNKKSSTDYRCYKDCPIPDQAKNKMTIFILAGQSNMSGRGELRKYPDKLMSHPRAFMFGNDYQWKPAYEPHDDATNQLDKVSADKNAGVSIAMSFAISLLEKNPDMYIGIVPCSKGGTVIKQWERSLRPNSLYGSCLARAKEAQQQGKIAALLFSQGESDARDPVKYPRPVSSTRNWGKLFSEFVNDFRQDINIAKLPVIYTQIGHHTSPKFFVNWKIIQQQQANINIPHIRMVPTKDLKLKDFVHYNTNSYIKLGQRFADAFRKLEPTVK